MMLNLGVDDSYAAQCDRIAIVCESRTLGNRIMVVKDRFGPATDFTEAAQQEDYLRDVLAEVRGERDGR